ncbi:hypothetical protein PpBr36_03311 [Pyricularia pennisetigena]|uniref:hypothetical protein n=1 Tax=Pyricularia pennisetigena TaxID=1578925 RepID=UPI00114FA230|nr:hypothetical protein PpBr36_03311 [Pyricularia pennisetigena]TLS29954.1 hypothetical protein PpBr36_03311 [Pyricularia pennisetigena]
MKTTIIIMEFPAHLARQEALPLLKYATVQVLNANSDSKWNTYPCYAAPLYYAEPFGLNGHAKPCRRIVVRLVSTFSLVADISISTRQEVASAAYHSAQLPSQVMWKALRRSYGTGLTRDGPSSRESHTWTAPCPRATPGSFGLCSPQARPPRGDATGWKG